MRAAVSKYAATFPEEEKEKIVTKRRESPTDSHASLGSSEVANQIIEGIWRTLRADLEETLGQKLKPTTPLLSWVLQYAAWCYNRFQPTRDDRRTPFERATLKTLRSPRVAVRRTDLGAYGARRQGPGSVGVRLLDRPQPSRQRPSGLDGRERFGAKSLGATSPVW